MYRFFSRTTLHWHASAHSEVSEPLSWSHNVLISVEIIAQVASFACVIGKFSGLPVWWFAGNCSLIFIVLKCIIVVHKVLLWIVIHWWQEGANSLVWCTFLPCGKLLWGNIFCSNHTVMNDLVFQGSVGKFLALWLRCNRHSSEPNWLLLHGLNGAWLDCSVKARRAE